MEKNIKRVGWLVVAAVLSMTFVACSNGIDAIDDSHQQVSYSMNVVASKTDGLESGLRGRALEVYGKMLKDEWKKGDEVTSGVSVDDLSVSVQFGTTTIA